MQRKYRWKCKWIKQKINMIGCLVTWLHTMSWWHHGWSCEPQVTWPARRRSYFSVCVEWLCVDGRRHRMGTSLATSTVCITMTTFLRMFRVCTPLWYSRTGTGLGRTTVGHVCWDLGEAWLQRVVMVGYKWGRRRGYQWDWVYWKPKHLLSGRSLESGGHQVFPRRSKGGRIGREERIQRGREGRQGT